MKIAVCYSGYLRILEKTFYHIKNSVLNNHDVDYFIHTWDNDSYLSEINFAKKNLKPKIFLKETPKSFERNPYSFINCSLTEEKYLDQLEVINLEPEPILVNSIIICSIDAFCISSAIINLFSKVRPLMYAKGII